ncbi:MAG: discoidin domain-containing protein [Planctomycetota bacterium]
MRHLIMMVCMMMLLSVVGCKIAAPTAEQPETPAAQPEETMPTEPTAEAKPDADAEMASIPLVLPKPMFVGTPQNLDGVENLEKPLGKARPPFMAPVGTTNLAAGKPVTASEEPIMGSPAMVVDGDKEAYEGSVLELGPFEQWIQIDLEKTADIYAVVVWHYHKTARVYSDVVVQISDDPDFAVGVTTVFNNDMDNSLGQGVGTDPHYVETAEGRLIDAKGAKGRYVRLWSQANNQDDYSHIIEAEVYGK